MSDQLETPIRSPSQFPFRSRAERIEARKELRTALPRATHANWEPPANRRDPIEILEESNQDRLPDLVPVRYGRMLRSPFTFLRGSAALMACDLASLPKTGIQVQACGDCHLLNFGLFATPERNLVFDINDFDETLPAPWEWDLKRLVTSFVIAGRDQGLSDEDCRTAAMECTRAYREHLREYSRMSLLEVWYSRLGVETIIEMAPDAETRKRREQLAKKAHARIVEYLFPKIVSQVGGRYRFVDQPPVLYHMAEADIEERMREGLEDYRQTLSDERRVLLDRYQLEDYAMKAVGIGSVGTRCAILRDFSPISTVVLTQVAASQLVNRDFLGLWAGLGGLPESHSVLGAPGPGFPSRSWRKSQADTGGDRRGVSILLMFSEENHPLILQVKEARRSVLEPYTTKCRYENQGQRVVVGQRLTQSSSDIFLGWVRGRRGFDFYVRQLRDMKMSAPIEGVTAPQVKMYAEMCGWILARAHAKSGDAATISGYLGKGDQFDEAMGAFSIAYADQAEQDYAALVKAERTSRIKALIEEDA